MTFKQIREIKTKYQGLKLNKGISGMFSNKHWASIWEIEFMNDKEMKELIKYLDENNLTYFFGRAGIHIQ